MTRLLIVFDSDGNVIDKVDLDSLTGTDAATAIGHIVLQHYELVDSTPCADEPFLTITRETPAPKTPAQRKAFARRIYPLG